MPFTMNKSIFLIPLFLGLAACGGASSTNTEYQELPSLVNGSIVHLDDNHSINQGIELFLYYPDDEVSNISWLQTSGEPVLFLTNKSKVISFTATHAGNYQFSVSYQLNGGATQTLTKAINVSEDNSPITARLSHEMLSGNKVSLRASIDTQVMESSLQWHQVSGPTVSLTEINTDGDRVIFFNAPNVNKDTILAFDVSAESNGQTYTDRVAVLVEPANQINSNAYFETRIAKVSAYKEQSPYAQQLTQCVYANSLTSSCTLAKLPLIANDIQNSITTPTIEEIMNRVVVSHQWMGQRFEEFLTHNDPHNDFKNLLRATTAIVISYDIRPSFYWAATGAIYLDAENFWLTSHERDTINEAPDYRADFGNDLQFVMPWRYVKNNAYASNSIDKTLRISRTADEGLYRLTSLMYHELAHANDFFPSNEWFSHQSNQRILDAALSTDFESDQLAITLPLTSQTMRNLAQVSFAGNEATQTQQNYLPDDIANFFRPDAATDFYAYSSEREDYAMLFEELMMQDRFGVIRDVAVTNQPTGNDISGSDYIVTWGQRGRIADEKIKPRVHFSASRILPEFDNDSAINALNAPILMIAGNNWIENLTISPVTNSTSKVQNIQASTVTKREQINNNFLPYYQKKLPKH